MSYELLATVQEAATNPEAGFAIGKGLGIAGAVIGAGLGIGPIGASMAQGIARQPEAAGQIQTAAIIVAALIEGAALFGLVLVFLG
jgi:F-type H+-transporting ATPase subunit c